MLLRLEGLFNRFADGLGVIAASLFVLLLANVFFDVIMRYLFNDVSIGMQEMEWHLYATIFLLGIPYGLRHGGHVRVDLVYERLPRKARAWIDLVGSLVFLIPFTLLVAWFGVEFTIDAWELGERSGDPGGLPHRWVIKSMIPLAFIATALSGVGMILHSINTLRGLHDSDTEETPYTGVGQ